MKKILVILLSALFITGGLAPASLADDKKAVFNQNLDEIRNLAITMTIKYDDGQEEIRIMTADHFSIESHGREVENSFNLIFKGSVLAQEKKALFMSYKLELYNHEHKNESNFAMAGKILLKENQEIILSKLQGRTIKLKYEL